MNSITRFIRANGWKILLVVLLIVAGVLLYNRLFGYQDLTISVVGKEDSGPVRIFKVTDRQGESASSLISDVTPSREVTATTTLRLPKGVYVVVSGDNPDFKKEFDKVMLEQDPVTTTIDPDYSSSRLSAMLDQARPAIQTAILQAIPAISDGYVIGPGYLYEKGEWYGTIIYPNLSSEELRLQYVDTYRVVVQKENDTWKVATLPPEISLNAVSYPRIPRDVLIGTDNQVIPN